MVRDTIYATTIDKDAYFEGSRFYLAVSADIRDADLIERTPKLLKAGSGTKLEVLISNALAGLRLQHVSVPPRSIPVKLRHQYFAIEQAGEVWDSVLRARNFAVYAQPRFSTPNGTDNSAGTARVGAAVAVSLTRRNPWVAVIPVCGCMNRAFMPWARIASIGMPHAIGMTSPTFLTTARTRSLPSHQSVFCNCSLLEDSTSSIAAIRSRLLSTSCL